MQLYLGFWQCSLLGILLLSVLGLYATDDEIDNTPKMVFTYSITLLTMLWMYAAGGIFDNHIWSTITTFHLPQFIWFGLTILGMGIKIKNGTITDISSWVLQILSVVCMYNCGFFNVP